MVLKKLFFINLFLWVCCQVWGQDSSHVRTPEEPIRYAPIRTGYVQTNEQLAQQNKSRLEPRVQNSYCAYELGVSNLSDLESLFTTECKTISEPATYCRCLLAHGLKGNDLIQSLHELTPKILSEYKSELKKEYKDRVLDVYTELNLGVSAQEQIFKMQDSKKKVIGCTPREFARAVHRRDKTEFKGEAFKPGSDTLKLCENNPDSDDCGKLIETISGDCYDNLIILENLELTDKAILGDQTNNKDGKPEEISSETRQRMDSLYQKFPKLKFDVGPSTPQQELEYFSCINQYYSEDPIKEKEEAIEDTEDFLKARNKKSAKKRLDEYAKLEPNQCLSYKDYQVIKSLPTSELLNELSSTGGGQDLFKIGGEMSPNSMKFLRSNPVLAKLATNDKGREFLGREMKAMATKLGANPSLENKVKVFSDFMKDKVAKKRQELEEINMCQMLADSMIAINRTDTLPPLPPLVSEGGLKEMENNLLACDGSKLRGNQPLSSLEDKLRENPLLFVMNGTSDSAKPKDDEDFKKFLEENCQKKGVKSWTKFLEEKMDAKCTSWLHISGGKNCREKFSKLGKKKTKELLAEYYAQVNPELGKVINLIHNMTSEVDDDGITARLDEKMQNNEAKSYYYTNVLPKIRKGYSSGGGNFNPSDIIEKEQKNFNKQQSAEETFRAPASTNDSVAPLPDNSNSFRDQVEPSWMKSPNPSASVPSPERLPLKPTNDLLNRSATDYLDPDPNQTYQERAEDRANLLKQIDKLEEQIKAGKIDSEVDKEKLQKQLKKFKQEIAEEAQEDRQEMSKNKYTPQDIPAVPRPMPSSAGAMNSNSMGTFGASNSRKAPKDGNKEMNRAVLDMYDEEKNKKIGSLTLESVPALESEVDLSKKPVEIVASEEEFKKVSADQKFAAELILKQLKRPITEGLVAIVDPTQKNKMILLKVSRSGNNFVVNPVSRLHRLDQLKQHFPSQN